MPDLVSWYPLIKWAHIGLVVASGVLFAIRGALVQAGQVWAMARPLRMLSYVIDTLLLTAGITLWVVLSIDPVSSPWLGMKLVLLGLYIVLGSLALKRARSPVGRRASYAGALAVYGWMAAVAVTHHPLGPLQHGVPQGG